MELTNDFRVNAPVDEAWKVLTDVERIAPCMPGAQLQEVEGDQYRGIVKVKVGPITAQYKGTATFVEKDDAGHRAVLRADGRDTRGQGNASATITATLVEDDGGTKVSVVTDLTVTGKVAQFGRGVLADVSGKLINQFVQCLERDVLAGPTATAAPGEAEAEAAPAADAPPAGDEADESVYAGTSTPAGTEAATTAVAEEEASIPQSTGPRRVDSPEPAPVDLLGTAGAPVARRIGPIIGVLIVILWLVRRRRRR